MTEFVKTLSQSQVWHVRAMLIVEHAGRRLFPPGMLRVIRWVLDHQPHHFLAKTVSRSPEGSGYISNMEQDSAFVSFAMTHPAMPCLSATVNLITCIGPKIGLSRAFDNAIVVG